MAERKPSAGRPRTRDERLAAALRANLRRRKAAARDRRDGSAEGGNPPEPKDSPDRSGPSGGNRS
jgi:hypothetical protein